MTDHVIGLDVSTTATKAVLVDEAGRVVATGVSEYSYQTPAPLWSEQDPTFWWEGTREAIRAALAAGGVSGDRVAAVGLTGQMHGLVLLDVDGQILRPAILWNDQRTAKECDEIRALVGRDQFIAITGNDALTGFTAPKLLWVKNEEPEIYARIRHVLLPKDYVRFRLTSSYATDKAGASGTVLFDLANRTWSAEVMAALKINPSWLPSGFEGPEVTGYVTEEGARATGLAPGTPVVAGGGDQAASAVGTGAVREGVVALSLGTSGVVFVAGNAPRTEPDGRLHAFCHAVPRMWHLMGVMLSAAGSLRWFRDELACGESFEFLMAEAAAASPGAEGLVFLPYLTGERTPYPDPVARGAFVGLTVRHGRSHLVRSVIEGVSFGLRDGIELMKGMGVEVQQIRASGGGTKSELWRQVLADVLGAEIVTVTTAEGAAFGAAILAAVGAEWVETVGEACDAWVTVGQATVPGVDQDRYGELYEVYRELYPALRPFFDRLSSFDRSND